LFEILTWAQLGIHQKPVALLNVNGFFTPLLAWLDHVVAEGLLRPKHRELLLVADTVPGLLDALTAWVPPEPLTKWVEAGER
jgi:predicted Rossmann-fold nucleotide-binding protein